jgi:kremen protein
MRVQSTVSDNTTKIFWTDRTNAKALFQPVYACNPDNDALQIQLRFLGGSGFAPGGKVCVRSASGNRYEFRYSPPGNPGKPAVESKHIPKCRKRQIHTDSSQVVDPSKPCMEVTMVLVSAGGGGVTTAPTTSPTSTSATSTSTSTSTTFSTSTTSTSSTSSSTSTPTSGPLPFTDMTSKGFAFQGCSPEARRANDGQDRTLTGASLKQDGMTNEICLNFCKARGYAYAGTEYRRECYCGNTVAATRVPKTTVASLKDCDSTCMGAVSEYCGGSSWLSLYKACPVGGPCVNVNFT